MTLFCFSTVKLPDEYDEDDEDDEDDEYELEAEETASDKTEE